MAFIAYQPTADGMAIVQFKDDKLRRCATCSYEFGPDADRVPLAMPGSAPGRHRIECENCQPKVMEQGHL